MTTIDDAAALRHVRALAASGTARTVRSASGLSLRECAEVVGVDPSTIHRWELGTRKPRGHAALRYAALLDRLMRGQQ